ncbi:hypothetical protein, partial [Actinotalea ferrariae]|uniref:hypothetical protein n=1 Tax=Actinotalea ferrariae TaxID=1386098 RepID=UPI00054F206F
MSVDRERTAPVELADVDAGDGRPSHGTDRAAVPDRRPSGARRWWVLGLLLVLGAGLAGGSGLSAAADRRDDDDVARLAPEPGFTASLREPLVERWRTTDRVVGVGAGVVLLADRSGGTGTAPALQAREAATGRVRWTAGWTPRAGVTRCEEAGAALLCDVPGAGFGAPNTDELLGEVPGRLLVVDPVDGRVEAEWDLDGRTVGWAVAGADVVVARREGDRLAVARYALEPATDRVAPTD